MVITSIWLCLILALIDDGNGIPNGSLAPLLIGILIAVISASMGPLTGFALNPAHNFGPKPLAFLVGWGKVAYISDQNIPYFLVPLIAPVVGACLGAFGYRALIRPHLPGQLSSEELEHFLSIPFFFAYSTVSLNRMLTYRCIEIDENSSR